MEVRVGANLHGMAVHVALHIIHSMAYTWPPSSLLHCKLGLSTIGRRLAESAGLDLRCECNMEYTSQRAQSHERNCFVITHALQASPELRESLMPPSCNHQYNIMHECTGQLSYLTVIMLCQQ